MTSNVDIEGWFVDFLFHVEKSLELLYAIVKYLKEESCNEAAEVRLSFVLFCFCS